MSGTTGSSLHHELGRVRGAGAALVTILLAAATVVLLPSGSGAASSGIGPVTVTVTPTTDVIDGQRLTINIRTSPDHPVYQAEAQVCRPGVDYAISTGPRPAPDFALGGDNCPKNGLSTSAQGTVSSQFTFRYAPTPEGETMYLRVGVGVVAWTTNDGTDQTLRCDQANPCVLVVQVRTAPAGQAPVWHPVVFPLTFRDDDPIAGCGGVAADVLNTSGSDSLSDAWVAWTRATCNTDGTTGAWTRMSFGDEGAAVGRFARGELDVVYTGVGYDPGAGFVEGITPRRTVAIPVGITAAVLTVGNGYIDQDGRKRPYGEQRITAEEMATLLSGGEWAMGPYVAEMTLRNPELGSPYLFPASTTAVKVGGPSESGATPYFTTRYLDVMAPDAWKVPLVPIPGGAFPGLDRGVHASLALADPTFNGSISLLTGRPGIAKTFGSLPPEGGGSWILTDLTTARAFDLPPVAVEARSGSRASRAPATIQFVAPTPEEMKAAADSMVTNPDGIRVPDPLVTEGYPLTYVVYALAPAEPLADADGFCRTGAQELLGKWLAHLVRDGQNDLPPGMEPLTPQLRAVAEERLSQVGATPAAVPCQQAPPSPVAGPESGGPVAAVNASGGGTGALLGGGRSGRPSVASLAGLAGSDGETASSDEVALSSSAPEVPEFAGGLLPSGMLAVLGLFGLVALPTVAARVSSGRGSRAPDRRPGSEWITMRWTAPPTQGPQGGSR